MWQPNRNSGHPANHDRWMVSYADFLTLLFAVFVVLFASAQMNHENPARVSEAVVEALDRGSLKQLARLFKPPSQKAAVAGGTVAAAPELNGKDLAPALESLKSQLSAEIKSGKIHIRLETRGLVVSLQQAAFFASGQAEVSPDTYSIMDKVGAVLAKLPNDLRLEGHTDAVPIRNFKYSSNWELSAARSIAVLDVLVKRTHLDRTRVSVAGFAETLPVGSNENAEGRARNRRVDLVILNDSHPR